MSIDVMVPEQRPAHELSRDECIAKLSSHSYGRIAVTHRGLPQILPINYAFDGRVVVIRTGEGGLLEHCCRDAVVAFEIDDYDSHAGLGWSVLVIGTAAILDARDSLRAIEIRLESVGAKDGKVFIRLTPGAISGRWVSRDD
jgi:nitroimidazol reductase NimA-like FMN-containing flavoprotein (pyridoxamine 5'-phosphate oxidase superfamily)